MGGRFFGNLLGSRSWRKSKSLDCALTRADSIVDPVDCIRYAVCDTYFEKYPRTELHVYMESVNKRDKYRENGSGLEKVKCRK